MKSFDQRLDGALRGEDTGITIYWDTSDPNNTGPAYRDEVYGDSAPLSCEGWNEGGVEVQHLDGYSLVHYFDTLDDYAGPDQDGVFPILTAD